MEDSYLNHGKQSYSIGFTRFEGSASQNNWFVGYGSGDWSFKMTNDAFVGGDKYRTAAAEWDIRIIPLGSIYIRLHHLRMNIIQNIQIDEEEMRNIPLLYGEIVELVEKMEVSHFIHIQAEKECLQECI